MFYSELNLVLFICVSLIFGITKQQDRNVKRKAPSILLQDGRVMPAFGFGTWLGLDEMGMPILVTNNDMQKAVEWAIEAGYRHFDTAFIYATEGMVGRAVRNKIKEGIVKREDIFITTKLWNDAHDDVVPALRRSLSALSMNYVDMYLIHFPFVRNDNGTLDVTGYVDTWKGMIQAQRLGLTKSIGVSNFNENMMLRIMSYTGIKPAVLQTEVNLNIQAPPLRAFCRNNNIAVVAYTPFGSLFYERALPGAPPPRVDDPFLVHIAMRHNKTVPQLALRYLVELGVVPIPKSLNESHIQENINVYNFALRPSERNGLRRYDVNYRSGIAWSGSPYYVTRSTS